MDGSAAGIGLGPVISLNVVRAVFDARVTFRFLFRSVPNDAFGVARLCSEFRARYMRSSSMVFKFVQNIFQSYLVFVLKMPP